MLSTKRARWIISTISECLRLSDSLVEVSKLKLGIFGHGKKLLNAGQFFFSRWTQENLGVLPSD
jgi:hypothetical protein